MPDRRQGYVKRGRGILPPDKAEAHKYRARQKEPPAFFTDDVQRLAIEESIVASERRRFRLHAAATESTHLHVLLSWSDERAFEQLRRGLRESITRRLNAHLRRRWLEQGGSRKRVADRRHFNYLMDKYIAGHSGWKWREGVGYYR
jgi:hypothetical protein